MKISITQSTTSVYARLLIMSPLEYVQGLFGGLLRTNPGSSMYYVQYSRVSSSFLHTLPVPPHPDVRHL